VQDIQSSANGMRAFGINSGKQPAPIFGQSVDVETDMKSLHRQQCGQLSHVLTLMSRICYEK
jgi:hypothetical protein